MRDQGVKKKVLETHKTWTLTNENVHHENDSEEEEHNHHHVECKAVGRKSFFDRIVVSSLFVKKPKKAS